MDTHTITHYKCACGSLIKKNNWRLHLKSNIHQYYLLLENAKLKPNPK